MKAEINVEVKGFEGGNLIKVMNIPFAPPIGYKLDLEIQGGESFDDCVVVDATWCEDAKSLDGGRLLVFCENDGFFEGELDSIKKDPSWKIE